MMKRTQSSLFLLLLLIAISVEHNAAQHQKTDRESNGLKGGVKTVKLETVKLTKNGDSLTEGKREVKSIEHYDQQGNLTQWENYLAGVLNLRVIYFNLDGERAVTFERLEGRGGAGPGNPGQPDPRFNFKYQYKYDANGNRIEIRRINNYNRLTDLTINKYDARENLVESKETEYFYNTKPPERVEVTFYKLNDKGETINETKPMYSIDYSDYKFDETGNWISRKVKMDFTYDGSTTTSFYVEYRTIKYHPTS